MQAILIAIISIFAVLVLQFRSFRQPLIVFLAIPFAFTGMVWGLLITGNSFSFSAFVGLTSLVGRGSGFGTLQLGASLLGRGDLLGQRRMGLSLNNNGLGVNSRLG